jgi:hypothetical protein
MRRGDDACGTFSRPGREFGGGGSLCGLIVATIDNLQLRR